VSRTLTGCHRYSPKQAKVAKLAKRTGKSHSHRRRDACSSCRSRRDTDRSARIWEPVRRFTASPDRAISQCVPDATPPVLAAGRQACPAPTPTPDSRSSEIAPLPLVKQSGGESARDAVRNSQVECCDPPFVKPDQKNGSQQDSRSKMTAVMITKLA
jgi:hypothetical protein